MEHNDLFKSSFEAHNAMLARHGLPPLSKIKPAGMPWSSKARKFVFAVKNVLRYFKAELNHAMRGAVDRDDAKQRLATCMKCEYKAVKYKGVVDPLGVGYCAGGCGCGATQRSLIQVKITIAGATCPKNKWETTLKTEGFSLKSLRDAICGIANTTMSEVKNGLKTLRKSK